MNKELDLLLVNPGAREQVYGNLSTISGIEPPLWCALIAGFVREKGYTVKIIDADAENLSPKDVTKKIIELNPLLTCIMVMGTNPSVSSTPKMTATHEILKILKDVSYTKTILGGLHPSSLPERTLMEESVDFVCQGEGFYTIYQLLDLLKTGKDASDYKINGLWYIKDNKVISNFPTNIKNLDELPLAAWDLLPMNRYRAHNWHCFDDIDNRGHYGVVYTSLGCPFKCTYCNIHALYGSKPGIRFRSPEKVIEEIDLLANKYKIKNLKISDELFTLKEEHVTNICNLLIEKDYGLNIWAYARVDRINKNILKKMKIAGINWLAYGFESANDSVRIGVDKKFGEHTIKDAVEMTHSAGICIIGNFMFGLPDDNLRTMSDTLNMAKDLNLEYVNFYTTIAYPGSQLYSDIRKNVISEKWHEYSQYGEKTLTLPTKYLSETEVLKFRDYAFEEYFNNPKYLKMVEDKFGPKVVDHIKEMLKHKIKR